MSWIGVWNDDAGLTAFLNNSTRARQSNGFFVDLENWHLVSLVTSERNPILQQC